MAAEDTLGFEQAREQLAEVVRTLEAGGLSLEESLALWERGERLAAICQQWLDGARARLAAATGQANGKDADSNGDRSSDDQA
jgi:exodeoxyribonuclease VII small subunit